LLSQFRNGQSGPHYAIDFLDFMPYIKKSFKDDFYQRLLKGKIGE